MFRTALNSLSRSATPALASTSRSATLTSSRQALATVPSFVNQKRNYHDKVIDHVSTTNHESVGMAQDDLFQYHHYIVGIAIVSIQTVSLSSD